MSERDGSRWERRTWPELKRICEELPEAGIHFQSMKIIHRFHMLVLTGKNRGYSVPSRTRP